MNYFKVIKPVQLAEVAGVELANRYKVTDHRDRPIARLQETNDLKSTLSRNVLTAVRDADFVLSRPDGQTTHYRTRIRNKQFTLEIEPAATDASKHTIAIEQSLFKKASISFHNRAGREEQISLPRIPFWSVFPNWRFRSSGNTIRAIKRRCRSVLLYWFTDQDGVYSVELTNGDDFELALGVVLAIDLLYFDDNNFMLG